MNIGLLFAVGCYSIWGVLPIFWKSLDHVSAFEVLAHRIIWSFVFMLSYLLLRRDYTWIKEIIFDWSNLWRSLIMAVLISTNWGLYIWGVHNDFVIETSLGYFINPLTTALLGTLVLKERPSRMQLLAFFIAASGVAYLTWCYGRVPWIALILATSFTFYGLLKRQTRVGAVKGLCFESGVVFLPALCFIFLYHESEQLAFGHLDLWTHFLLVISGVFTGIPLILFALAAKRVPMISLGILQYLAPVLQFVIGIFVFKEDFSQTELVGFCLIWLALSLFVFDGLSRYKKRNEGRSKT